jgi:hypothetical protein
MTANLGDARLWSRQERVDAVAASVVTILSDYR